MENNEQINRRRYLVCVDEREECLVAVQLACMKVVKNGGAVTLLHVIPPADFQTLFSIAERMREERLRDGELLLDKLLKESKDRFGITPSLLLMEGSAGDKIVEAAMNDPDIIMLMLGVAHKHHSGRGKLASWLGGQLGDTMLIPMLLVPGNLTQQQLSTLI